MLLYICYKLVFSESSLKKCSFTAEVPCPALCVVSVLIIIVGYASIMHYFFIMIKTILRKNFNEKELKSERHTYWAVVILAIAQQWCLNSTKQFIYTTSVW